MHLEKKSQPIDKQFIFSKIDSSDIYRHEIGQFTVGRAFNNPLRKDRSPSMCIYKGQNGQLRHIDYADSSCSGGAIDLVMQKYGIKYQQALDKIAVEFQLLTGAIAAYKLKSTDYVKNALEERKHCLIQIATRNWNKADSEYWMQYGITRQQLTKEQVHPVKELYINRKKEIIGEKEIVYAYQFPEGLKIYMPTREKTAKWKSSIPTRLVENLQVLQGADKVIISKSKKDRLLLESLLPGIAIINTQNESVSAYTDSLLEQLKDKKVYLSYDSDPAGVKASWIVNNRYPWMEHLNVPYKYLPSKDWSDMYKNFGPEPIIQHMKEKSIIK